MKVIVTGGAGFVGTKVVDRLLHEDVDTVVVDIVDPGRRDVEFVAASVTDGNLMRRHLTGADAVLHLAGFVRGGMRQQPYQGGLLQLQGTLNVLEGCRRNGVAHVGFASSFYVYDGIDSDTVVDEDTPLDPRHMELFGSAKLMGEALCREFADRYELTYSCYRLGPVYGGPKGTSAVDNFVDMGLRGETIDVWGRGRRRNQYTHVGDVADGIVAGLDHHNRTYNLVSDESVALSDLSDLLRHEFGFDVVFDPERPEGPSFPHISCDRAVAELGWSPLELSKGIRLTREEFGRDGEQSRDDAA